MGGIGSGARRKSHVGNVEDVLALDIRRLRRLGVARAGECVIDDIRWSIGGLGTSCVRVRVDLSDVERVGSIVVAGDMPDGAIRQQIAIELIPSGFNGWRCYFICPATSRRCEVLYYLNRRFACREEQALSYAVQGMDAVSRARRKAAKLRCRLRGSWPMTRARGSKRAKVVKLLGQTEAEARALYLARLRTLTDGSGARGGPGGRH